MPRHERERRGGQLKRAGARRPPYDRVLIVCEGSKTEPLYFDAIRQANRIPAAHIAIMPSELGTEPRQVVDFAVAHFNRTKQFEHVYAVFDRDEHNTYSDALQRAQALHKSLKNDERKVVEFLAVPSVPCFELWLLLHFEDVFAFGHRSEMTDKLKVHIPHYAKGVGGIYKLTEPKLAEATARAISLKGRFNAENGVDPVTHIHELVQQLQNTRL
jgi:hypothetical protein